MRKDNSTQVPWRVEQRMGAGALALPRLHADIFPAAVYAVGDVHGHLTLLRALEDKILTHGANIAGEKWIVMLGDYVDRGPEAAQVIEHLLTPAPQGWRRICLRGNHEQAMIDAFASRDTFVRWLAFGAEETLASYGLSPGAVLDGLEHWPELRALIMDHIPGPHLAFLAGTAGMLTVPGYVFVHAGLRPGTPLDAQSDFDLLWIREPIPTPEDARTYTVVHGHTPVEAPEILPGRINIDTGAFATGRLTAMAITAPGEHEFLYAKAF